MSPSSSRKLPGDRPQSETIARMIRVNQAGEYGAMRIYAGQRDFVRDAATRTLIEHMAAQEQAHLDWFNRELSTRRIRPTLLTPLWHAAGYALGAATAMMGSKTAMLCTEAVEAVIGTHYAAQEAVLPEQEQSLKDAIAAFRADEQEHHRTALDHGASDAPLHSVLYHAISSATRLAIWLSKRL